MKNVVLAAAVAFALSGAAFSSPSNPRESSVDDDFFCYVGRGERPGRRPPAGLVFTDELVLAVSIQDPEKLLTQAARVTLEESLLDAIRIWRRACRNCPAGGRSFVRADDTIFANSFLVAALRRADAQTQWRIGPPAFDLGSPTGALGSSTPQELRPLPRSNVIPYDILLLQMASVIGTRTPPVTYETITMADPLVGNVCSWKRDVLPPLIQRVYDVFNCPTPSTTPRSFSMNLLIKDGHTSCGLSPNIVACEADPSLVELNGHDYSFVAHGANGQPLFGRGGRSVDVVHVLLHELGHWIGLPHLEANGNLMAESMAESRCVDDAVVDHLDALIAGTDQRYRNKGTFYFARPGSESRR